MMKMIGSTKLGESQTLPLVFSTLLHSRGVSVQRLQFVKMYGRKDIGRVCSKRLAWSLEKCNGNGLKTVKMGLVRPATEEYVEEVVEAMRTGKVIAVPTDTLYGFACDACSTEAIHQIYEIKGREHTKPLAISVEGVHDIQRFAITSHLPHELLGPWTRNGGAKTRGVEFP